MILARVRVQARANWGRWIVDCPHPYCWDALKLAPHTPLFECWSCGTRAEIEWPPESMISGIERLLSMRPNVTTRNWIPGETLIDLMIENGANCVFDDLPPALEPGSPLLTVDETHIRTDYLPKIKSRVILQELEA